MADYFIGLNRGQQKRNVTKGASTGSTHVELRIETTTTKAEAVELAKVCIDQLIEETWPK